jgi:hypothetical protein|tara:strand:- start:150 stop:575 length:426 start_codon:yes stop_codon:yes gene_type:complete
MWSNGKSCWHYCQQLPIGIGAMKKLYQSIRLLIFFILMIIISHITAAEDFLAATALIDVSPVMLEDLDQIRGLGGVADVISNANLEAVLNDNDVTDSVNGYNIIDQGSFNDASGVFSIIQNTGNNVIIQDSTIITITVHSE